MKILVVRSTILSITAMPILARTLLIAAALMSVHCVVAQQPETKRPVQTQPQSNTPTRPSQAAQSGQASQQVSPDTPVVTIRGLCPAGQPAIGRKSEACTVVLTRADLETMVSAINMANQSYPPTAMRSLASGFVTIMALADAGEKAGLENTPSFRELMRVARTRALADSYRRFLREKFSNPSSEEIENYYQQNLVKFEQLRIERIFVPKLNPKRSQDKPSEFAKRARQVAEQIRDRAAKGEDVASLQTDVYKLLAIHEMPPQTDLNELQRKALSGTVQKLLDTLKPGEVTKVQEEPTGFNIYKIGTKNMLSLEQARNLVVHELSQKNFDSALKMAVEAVHPEFNEQFFSDYSANRPPPAGSPTRVPRANTRDQMSQEPRPPK
jgi:PPIC-type PPIASE domain